MSHRFCVPDQDTLMYSSQKKTNTQRALSDRKHLLTQSLKPLQSSATAARGPAPPRPAEQGTIPEAYYTPSAAAKPTTAVTKSPDSEPRTRLTLPVRAATPQHSTIGGATTGNQPPVPPSSRASVGKSGYAAASTHSAPEARPGVNTVAKAPNHTETSVATSGHAPPDAYPSTGNVPQLPPTAPDESPMLPNILIFGETGTGKSSLINMLAGRHIAGVSSDALGYTFGSQVHEVSINGNLVKLWDTAGLNEGEHGTVPAEQAVRNLQDLVHNLKGGVNLLVYCIRGTRFRDIMQINYDLFCNIICQNMVPVVIVVTGLENESPMESWWEENGAQLKDHGMDFTGHACVTTTRGKQLKSGEYTFEEEFEESEDKTRKLITDHYLRTPWVMKEGAWLAEITSKLAGYYSQQAYGEADLAESRQSLAPNSRNSSAGILLWKLSGYLARGFSLLVYGPQRQLDRTRAGTQPSTSRRRDVGTRQ